MPVAAHWAVTGETADSPEAAEAAEVVHRLPALTAVLGVMAVIRASSSLFYHKGRIPMATVQEVRDAAIIAATARTDWEGKVTAIINLDSVVASECTTELAAVESATATLNAAIATSRGNHDYDTAASELSGATLALQTADENLRTVINEFLNS